MADDTPTVEQARETLEREIINNSAMVRGNGSYPTIIPTAAIDALIAAVRAEHRPEPCADHPTAEMVTVCETCIEQQITALKHAVADAAAHAQPFPERNMTSDPSNPPNLSDAAEMLWTVIANVSGGDWTQQSQEWQDAAAHWRDYYFQAVNITPRPTHPPS